MVMSIEKYFSQIIKALIRTWEDILGQLKWKNNYQ